MFIFGTHGPQGRATARGACAACAAAAGLALVAAIAGPALADRVVTKTGETFTGTIVQDDKDNVVLRTLSGTMTIPRDAIKSVEKAGPPAAAGGPPAAAPQVVVVPVEPSTPANAAQALKDAKAALVAGEWAKAAGLLEGLMLVDEKTLSVEDRLAANGALITCYLQIKDAQGSARNIARRAMLATDANDKRRLLAAAELLKTVGAAEMNGKALTRLDEVVDAAMAWKATQCLADAKATAAKATRLNEAAQLEKAAAGALKKLAEADVYVPGYSTAHRKEPLGTLVNNVLQAAQQTAEFCEKERQELTRTAVASVASRATAKVWNDRATPYFARRQAAEEALKNLYAFATKFDVADLYKANEAAVTDLLKKLDDFQYYPEGTVFSYGWYGSYTSPDRRIRMQLRH